MVSLRAAGIAYHTLLPVVLPLPFRVTSRSTEFPLVLAA